MGRFHHAPTMISPAWRSRDSAARVERRCLCGRRTFSKPDDNGYDNDSFDSFLSSDNRAHRQEHSRFGICPKIPSSDQRPRSIVSTVERLISPWNDRRSRELSLASFSSCDTELLFKCSFVSIDYSSHLYKRVCPSVRRLVTLSSKTREMNIFEQVVDRGSILGSPDAS